MSFGWRLARQCQLTRLFSSGTRARLGHDAALVTQEEISNIHTCVIPSQFGLPFLSTLPEKAFSKLGAALQVPDDPKVVVLKEKLARVIKEEKSDEETVAKLDCPKWLDCALDELNRFKALATLSSRILTSNVLHEDLQKWPALFQGQDVPLNMPLYQTLQTACAPYLVGKLSSPPPIVFLRNADSTALEYIEYIAKRVAHFYSARFLSISPHDLPYAGRPLKDSTASSAPSSPRRPRRRPRPNFHDINISDGAVLRLSMGQDGDDDDHRDADTSGSHTVPREFLDNPSHFRELLDASLESFATTASAGDNSAASVLFIRDFPSTTNLEKTVLRAASFMVREGHHSTVYQYAPL